MLLAGLDVPVAHSVMVMLRTIVLQLLGQSEILLVGQQADAKDIL